jgi:hypothetical protein
MAVVETARKLAFLSPFLLLQDGLGVVAGSGNYGTLRFAQYARGQQAGITDALLRERRMRRAEASERTGSVWDVDPHGNELRLVGVFGISYAGIKPQARLGGCVAIDDHSPLDERSVRELLENALGLSLWGVAFLAAILLRFEVYDVR